MPDCEAFEKCLDTNVSNKVGKGAFATVSKFTCRNKEYVRKDIAFELKVDKDSYETEVKTFKILKTRSGSRHGRTHVVHAICAIEYPDKGTLVLDVADTNLWYYAYRKPIPKKKVLDIFNQLQLGMKFFHSKYIIHNDIKSSNILVFRDEHVKFCDFGNAMTFESFETPSSDLINEVLDVETGTYHPPETVSDGKLRKRIIREYDPRCKDYWCLGEVFYYIMFLREPFSLKALGNILQSGKLRRKMPDWLKTSLLNVDFKNRRSVDLSQNLEIPERSSLTYGGGVMHQRNHWDNLYK